MIKISHESPLCLLGDSLRYNDYQYILPYFWYRFEEYKNFMIEYGGQVGSFIILDNGLFEGETYTIDNLVLLVNEVKPDIFIVPDEWNNPTTTHVNAKYWAGLHKSKILPENTKLMVVLQGKTFSEIKQLYRQCVDLGYTHFAFNHSSISYESTKFESKSRGRIELIHECVNEGIIKPNHYIHLLGAIDINEFSIYETYFPGLINSIDTSSPVLLGCYERLYNIYTSTTKPPGKIEDFFEKHLNIDQKYHIFTNINTFKNIVNK